MKKFLILILLVCSVTVLLAQKSNSHREDAFAKKMFVHHGYTFPDSENASKTRVDFYIDVVNDLLTFFKTSDSLYTAAYEIGVVFYSNKNEAVTEATVKDTINVSTFKMTNSRKNPSRHKMTLSLKPGKYYYIIQLDNGDTVQPMSRKTKVEIRGFSADKVQMSDIIFVDKINDKNYAPNLSHSFNDINSAFSTYFEVYPAATPQPATVNYVVKDYRGKAVFIDDFSTQEFDQPMPIVHSLRDSIKTPGEYFVEVSVQSGSHKIFSQERFTVNWSNLKMEENNLNLLVEQIRLIALKDDYQAMVESHGEQREKVIADFWKKRDPTPETSENELQQEFMRRIDFVNRNFSEPYANREGWRSARGQIYIKNGPPEQVERQPAEMNRSAVEVWNYPRLERRYIFVDKNGNGVFRLVKVE